jgi:hypothetical protein
MPFVDFYHMAKDAQFIYFSFFKWSKSMATIKVLKFFLYLKFLVGNIIVHE